MGGERDTQHLKLSFRLAPRSCSFLPSRQQVRQLTRLSGKVLDCGSGSQAACFATTDVATPSCYLFRR